jgi:hypothetical protein
MSSFFGMVRQQGKPVEERLLQRIADEFTFQGPDGTRLLRQANVSACFPWMGTGPARQVAKQPVTLGNTFLLCGHLHRPFRHLRNYGQD